MNADMISEAWQAMSVLSDAQEVLPVQSAQKSNALINHAKRHLNRVFELAREEDAVAFRKAIMLIGCTLGDKDEQHGIPPGAIFLGTLLQQVEGHIASHGESCQTAAGCIHSPEGADDECGGKGLFMLREAIRISNRIGGKE